MKRNGIYVVLHVPTGSAYIGGSNDCVQRFTWHRHALRNNYHTSSKLQELWNTSQAKEWVFAVVEFVSPRNSLRNREQHWLENWSGRVLNTKLTADGVGYTLSVEIKAKLSEAAKRVANSPEGRKVRSEKAKLQHAEGRFGTRYRKNKSETAY